MAKDERLASSRRRFVVKALGGDPSKMTRKEYDEKYLAKEAEVLAKYPTQDLNLLRKPDAEEGTGSVGNTKTVEGPITGSATANTGQGKPPVTS